ncbi:hypothetical protein H6758_04300 [Candidatus Nomurabacteria bacterium]|nr:hypothetical protein [Candidatus Nomurabacteria bacterium]
MKKQIFIVAGALIALVFVAGCGAKKPMDSDRSPEGEKSPQMQDEQSQDSDTMDMQESKKSSGSSVSGEVEVGVVSDAEIDEIASEIMLEAELEADISAQENTDSGEVDNDSEEFNNLMQTYEEGQF